MDRAYEGDATRPLALDLGDLPRVPPKSNRLDPQDGDRAMYRKRPEHRGFKIVLTGPNPPAGLPQAPPGYTYKKPSRPGRGFAAPISAR
jgi:hypothetical protein